MSRLFCILTILLFVTYTARSQDTAIAVESKDAAAIEDKQDSAERKLDPIIKKSSKALDTAIEAYNESKNADLAIAEDDIPFLTGYYYASSATNSLSSFSNRVKEISRWKATLYRGEAGIQPVDFSLPDFPANARLALFFRNWTNQSQYLLEYRLLSDGDLMEDTSITWHKAKSVIIIPKLANDANYRLIVRYVGTANNISEYFFKSYSYKRSYLIFIKKHIAWFCGFFIAFNILLLLRYINTKRRSRQYQLELKSLFAQLNPHFVFNSLSSIQGLMNNNEIEKANQYLSGFSGLLRTTLDKGSKPLIPLSEEIDNLENYIHFEQLRFEFQYEKDIEPSLSTEDIYVLPLLPQPLIENSVKHGISGMGKQGKLSIRIYTLDRDLFISIKDNGVGFDVDEYKSGYGVDLVRKRINAYNKWHRKTKIIFTMKSERGNTMMILQFQKWLPK